MSKWGEISTLINQDKEKEAIEPIKPTIKTTQVEYQEYLKSILDPRD
jgi:hypothetical protein